MLNWLFSHHKTIYFLIALRHHCMPERVYRIAHNSELQNKYVYITYDLLRFGVIGTKNIKGKSE